MTARHANVLTGLALAGLLALVALTSPRWARYLREPLAGAPAASEELEPAAATPTEAAGKAEEPAAPERRISVKLFFEDPEQAGLVMEEREVLFSNDLARQIRVVLEQLIEGSRAGKLPPFPPETKVIEVFVTAWGTAYVDLSKEAALGVGGSKDELLAVYAVVNSITTNFPAVARVQILVDDRPADTLAGHVDLSRPLPPDMTLLAAVDPSAPAGAPLPEGTAPGAPAAAPSPAS
jgi:hypothetical protein